ncbi:MAG TPA: CoA-binding protein [Prolixibacteraceae bacterium]|nr:CoA-binding protein [Prolixibacteraceae bacterium]
MILISKKQIDRFLDCKTMAIAGASRNDKSFSALVAKQLEKVGYDLWYVNPQFEAQEAEKQRVQSVAMLPDNVSHLLIITPKAETESVVRQAIDKGIKSLWIQQKSETPEALKLAQQNYLATVHHQCIFMFTEPEGIHKFHHRVKAFFRALPK